MHFVSSDLNLLSRILILSVVVYQLELWNKKSDQDASDSEIHARNRYAVADKITKELQEESLSF